MRVIMGYCHFCLAQVAVWEADMWNWLGVPYLRKWAAEAAIYHLDRLDELFPPNQGGDNDNSI